MQDGKQVILCIDDDQDFLLAMRIMLERNGYTMVEAETAEDGLKVYLQAKPDAVLVDLMMEEVDAGVHFVKELQAVGNDVPVYMLSSVGDSLSDTTDYAQLGLSGILQKPIVEEELVALLKAKL